MISQSTLSEAYWLNFKLEDSDLEYLYNLLLDNETPLTPQELLSALVRERINIEKKRISDQTSTLGKVYFPKENYLPGDVLAFPLLNWNKGQVKETRTANNPSLDPFSVIHVQMENGEMLQFASNLLEHELNTMSFDPSSDDDNLNPDSVIENNSEELLFKLNTELEQNTDLVRIAGRWFPRSLLVEVNLGYLNMAEAVLDVEGGGPLTTKAILEQIELPTDVNMRLTEFSLNHALQEDPRFDEVGPSGEILWFLNRYEPEFVRQTPPYLKYPTPDFPINPSVDLMTLIKGQIFDELEPDLAPTTNLENEIKISLLYPHWRSGTLPLAGNLKNLLPTALESPRIRFDFVDKIHNKRFPGWIVRNENYAYGLREWYDNLDLIPGSIISLKKGEKNGEVTISSGSSRPTRDWIRTALVGADGGVVFAMLKQMVPAGFDDRMAIAIPDMAALDKLWESNNKAHTSLEKIAIKMMRELAKLNPQGHINFFELYSAINIVRRCPPSPLVSLLSDRPWSKYLGDLYFRLDDTSKEENSYA